MTPIKRMEIITAAVELPDLLAILDALGISGYTVLEGVRGRGHRGNVSDDEVTGVFKSVYVLIACTDEESRRIAESLRPILRRFGGVCLVSDAMWIKH